jgi:hypothetical protein|tara:strand:- start:1309 stop:1638 length:330 start_codon:yes stop_codon:yes gene_type:complete
MISNSVAPHAGKAAEPFVQKIILRYVLDRCCKKHLRKKANLEESFEEEKPHEKSENEGGSILAKDYGTGRPLIEELYEGGRDGSSERPSRSAGYDTPQDDETPKDNDTP